MTWKLDGVRGPAAFGGEPQVNAIASDVAAEGRGTPTFDDAQELTLPTRRLDTSRVGEQRDLRFNFRVGGTALRGQRALSGRWHPPFGRQFDHRERGQTELQAREPGTGQHDGIHAVAFGEFAQSRRHVSS